MQSCPWHVAEMFDDINDQVGFWEDLYLFTLDPHVPKRKFRVRPKKLPWINEDIRDLMKHTDWLHKRAIRDCSSITWDMYKAARNKVTSEIKKSKATYFNNLSTSKINQSRLWKHLNHLLSRTNRESVKSLLVNGSELTNKMEIAEVMNYHFISATDIYSLLLLIRATKAS